VFGPQDKNMNFFRRLLNYFSCNFAKVVLDYAMGSITDILTERGLPYPDITQGLVLVTSQFGMEHARNFPPNVKLIGPTLSISRQVSNPQLDEVLDQALKAGKDVIYLSLGTIVSIPPSSIEELVKGLGKLNNSYVVVWSLRKHQQETVKVEIPQNIRVFTEQIPQLSLLSHPSVKLFLSHCGANSLIEALYFGVPIIGLPVAADQFGNAAMSVDLGTGVTLDVTNLDATTVFETVTRVLNSSEYRLSAQKYSTILQESRGPETGAREIEFFATIKDATHFLPKTVPWYVRTHVDIFLFIVVLLIILWKLTVMCCRRCISKCFYRAKEKKE